MSVLERRVQILVERAQYERLERDAAAQSRSVASLIRDAIAVYLDSGSGARSRALGALLDMPADAGPGEDWEDSKDRLRAQLPEYR